MRGDLSLLKNILSIASLQVKLYKDAIIYVLGIYHPKGPSKNYVTARGGEGFDDFVTYPYEYLGGGGRGYFMK